jgi:hypothetical protein
MRKRMVGAISVAMLVAGCGASNDYANNQRPAKLVQVDVNVTDTRVLVSPSRLGAGPVVVIVSNQSGRSRDVTLAPPEGSTSACLEADASSGPINPMGTAKLKVDLVEGDCLISAGPSRRAPRPALLTVGRERPSAQAELLLP